MATSNEQEIRHAEQSMRAALQERLETGQPLHPWYRPYLDDGADPTAGASANASPRLRTIESAFMLTTIETLLIGLTPAGMLAVALACLQHLSGEHGDLPDGIAPEQLDPWNELIPFQQREADFGTFAEECGRAGWHLMRVAEASGVDG